MSLMRRNLAQPPGRGVPGGRLLLALGLTFGLLGTTSGCFAPVAARCPDCKALRLGERPPIPLGTRHVVVLVPGLIGYGWEWDAAQSMLRRIPDAAILVYSWDPWQSLRASSRDLGAHLAFLLRRLPKSTRDVTLFAHSASGLLAVRAAGELNPPPGVAVRILSIGAPLAGMGFNPWSGTDLLDTPLPIALGGRYTRWPDPPLGVELEIYPTGQDDPVMRRRGRHEPGDPRVLPGDAELRSLPQDIGHNLALGYLAEKLRDELAPPPPPGPPPLPPRPTPPFRLAGSWQALGLAAPSKLAIQNAIPPQKTPPLRR